VTESLNMDLFAAASSGGAFPKVDDFEGHLILLRPTLIEQVPKPERFGGKPGEKIDRLTADVTVFDYEGEPFQSWDDMYFSQTVIVNAARGAMKPGRKPMVLGRLVKVATKATRDAMKIGETPEDFAKARGEWLKKGGKGPEPRHVWLITEFDETDAEKARAYLATLDAFAAPSS
jgi:hypothetical protein